MDVSVNFRGGGSFVKLRPKFSNDSENVFISSRNSIFEYSSKTGKLIYEYKGMENEIVGFSLNIIEECECIVACSKKGQIIVWKTGMKTKIVDEVIKKNKIRTFHAISTNLESGLDILISHQQKNGKICFVRMNTKRKEDRKTLLELENDHYNVDVCGNHYFSTVQNNTVYFVNLSSFKLSSYSMAKNNRTFTCVACHSSQEIVLTGDNTGRVIVWQNIFDKKSQAVYHWHTLPVKCAAFANLGSYFYSGADECVLVKWQFENVHQKQFLPRLPAGICHITVSENNAYIAVTTTDNAIRIVDSRMNQISLIQHLVFGQQFESGIIYDPITRALVFNSNVGCVQFYSANDMTLLYNVDIVNQNKITDERECRIENTDVRKIALSKCGQWLATVEERREKEKTKELRLKFWVFNSEKQTYELNTSIEDPHQALVNSIAFQPSIKEDNFKCVTVGNDRIFKIWQKYLNKSVYRSGPAWKCVAVGSHRDLPCQSLSFSIDGSLFATAFKAILTTWSPDTCELKCSLVHPNFKEKLKSVQFGQGNQCHLIATVSENQLSVWNILTLSLVWVVHLPTINLLLADPLSTYMMVICGENKVFLFEPSSHNIIYSSDDLLKKNRTVVAATFSPSKYSNDTRLKWYERSNLYFIDSNSELYCVSKSQEPFEYIDSLEDLSESISVFTKIKPIIKTSHSTQTAKYHLFEKDDSYRNFKEYLEAPIHTLPPMRLLAASLLKSLIHQKENSTENTNQ